MPLAAPVAVRNTAGSVNTRASPKSPSLARATVEHEDVAGLDVAMHNPGRGRHRERAGHVVEDGEQGRRRQRASFEHVIERGAGDELHHQERVRAARDEVVHPHDRGVVQPGQHLALATEPDECVGVGEDVPMDALDRHQPVEGSLPGEHDVAERAGAQRAHEFEFGRERAFVHRNRILARPAARRC